MGASIPGAAGHLTLTEVVDTAHSYPEPDEYQHHVHLPPSEQLPLGRNVRFCKDRKALKFDQLYHAHDYPEIGSRPRGNRAHLSFPVVCLRWAVAVAAALLEEPVLSPAGLLDLNPLTDSCPDAHA